MKTLILGLAMAVRAATVSEADFAPGYWDQDFGGYGRQSTIYAMSFAAADPTKARAAVEALLGGAGGKLTGFSDQSAALARYGGMREEYVAAMRQQPIYTLAYQFPEGKAAAVAKKALGLGRLITYNVQSPYQAVQVKELDERVAWLEKEKTASAAALKSMPVSRALLESKLKKLRAAQDAVKATSGWESVSVSILREDPSPGPKPAPAQP